MTRFVSPFLDAWSQVKVHRARFVLSLLGVFIAVFAMTTAAAVGSMGRQMVSESFENMTGRSAALSVTVMPTGSTPVSTKALQKEYARFVQRHKVKYSSMVTTGSVSFRAGGATQQATAQHVDPAWGTIHRVKPIAGRWLTEADRQNMSPAIVINSLLADQIGYDGSKPLTIKIMGSEPVVATVVGAIRGDTFQPQIYSVSTLSGTKTSQYAMPPTLEMWVPPSDASTVQQLVTSELGGAFKNATVDAYQVDGGMQSGILDNLLGSAVKWAGYLVLGLGALGVINVAIVTVRQRIREIGIRRSFGATSGQVFSTVLLETALATAATGALAVATAIAVVPRLPIDDWVGNKELVIADVPPFPIDIALQGLAAATVVGLLAGLIPAIIAVKSDVVKAIRF